MSIQTITSEWESRQQRSESLPDRLAEFVLDAIRAGDLHPGERLPSESEFAEQLGVSRATWRAAVQNLVAQGILERRHGVGTFIADTALLVIEEGLEALTSTTDVIRQHGYEPGTSASYTEVMLAPAWLSEILEIPPDTPVLHLSRTRTANNQPVIQCEEFVSTTVLAPHLLPEKHDDWSLYKLLASMGEPVASAICRLKAVDADETMSQKLGVPQGYALLMMQQTHLNANNEPILYCENYHNSAVIEFKVLRRR